MAQSELNAFAQRLIELVRDRAIAASDSLARGSMRGSLGERWRSKLSSDEARAAILELLPDVVDQALFALLDAIDNDRLPLAWQTPEGTTPLEELGQGEMGGLLMMGRGGWIDRYSKQRFFDPLSDLDP